MNSIKRTRGRRRRITVYSGAYDGRAWAEFEYDNPDSLYDGWEGRVYAGLTKSSCRRLERVMTGAVQLNIDPQRVALIKEFGQSSEAAEPEEPETYPAYFQPEEENQNE